MPLSRSFRVFALAVALTLAPAGTAHAETRTLSDFPSAAPEFDGPVYAVAYAGGTLYVGGAFHHAIVDGHPTPRGHLAAIDGATGRLLPWAPTTDGTVEAIAADPVTVYVAGRFTAVEDQPRAGLAGLDAATGALSPFRPSLTGTPDALALGNHRLYVAGRLTSVDSRPAGNLTAFRTDTGAVDGDFHATADDVVKALYLTGTRLYLGGLFHRVDAADGSAKLAAVDPDSGAWDDTFTPSVKVLVYGIAGGSGAIYAALGGQGGRVSAYGPTGSTRWTATTDGDVQALAYLDGVVYAGGHFDHACVSDHTGSHGACTDGADPRVKLAAVDAGTGTWLPWNPTANGIHGVFALASDPVTGTVAAGGEFTTVDGAPRRYLAQFGAWLEDGLRSHRRV